MASRYFNAEYNQAPKRARLCWSDDTGYGIALHQRGKDSFVVTYGKQVDDGLTYAEACTALGQALLHALSCEDKVDNRMKGGR